ncbi:MAG: hypothetical protein HY644_03630 [Acidobacteria bacterium]|nr:hypothetical protein [Acidobacteriota bacterium]
MEKFSGSFHSNSNQQVVAEVTAGQEGGFTGRSGIPGSRHVHQQVVANRQA